MSDQMQNGMVEATRLVREGRLNEATAVIQSALGGPSPRRRSHHGPVWWLRIGQLIPRKLADLPQTANGLQTRDLPPSHLYASVMCRALPTACPASCLG